MHWKRQASFCLKEIQNRKPSAFHPMGECLLPFVAFHLRAQMQRATHEQALNRAVRAAMWWTGSTVHRFVALDLLGVKTMVLSHSEED